MVDDFSDRMPSSPRGQGGEATAPAPFGAQFVRDVQRLSVQRANRWHAGDFRQWTVLEWAGAMCGEAGEAANVAKKLRRAELALNGNEASEHATVDLDVLKYKLGRECADVFLYLVLLAASYAIDLQDMIVRTFNAKSDEMGFPERIEPRAPRIVAAGSDVDQRIPAGSPASVDDVSTDETTPWSVILQNARHKAAEAACKYCEGAGHVRGSEWLGTDYEMLRCPMEVHSRAHALECYAADLSSRLRSLSEENARLTAENLEWQAIARDAINK